MSPYRERNRSGNAVVSYGLWNRAAFNVTHFDLATLLVWVVNPRQ
jgi:hypothetical protein